MWQIGIALFALAVFGPSLIREIAWQVNYFLAKQRPPLPPRSVRPFADNIASISFAGNGGDSRQAQRATGVYPNSAAVIRNPIAVQPEPSDIITEGPYRHYKTSDINIAQGYDVTCAKGKLLSALATDKGKRFVVHGTSRGAAVALQIVAGLPSNIVRDRIALLFCEAPFTTVEDVIDVRYGHNTWLSACVRFTLRWFTSYDARDNDVWSPLAAARTFPHVDLPIVVVSSLADRVVPSELQGALVAALRGSGAKNVHEIQLKSSPHPAFTWDNDSDRRTYVDSLDAIYKLYEIN